MRKGEKSFDRAQDKPTKEDEEYIKSLEKKLKKQKKSTENY